MPLTEVIARLLGYYDVCPIQLLPLIVLIYERAKMLEKAFKKKFGFEEIVTLVEVVQEQGHDYPFFDAPWRKAFNFSFTGEPRNFGLWFQHAHVVKANWDYPNLCTHNRCRCEHSMFLLNFFFIMLCLSSLFSWCRYCENSEWVSLFHRLEFSLILDAGEETWVWLSQRLKERPEPTKDPCLLLRVLTLLPAKLPHMIHPVLTPYEGHVIAQHTPMYSLWVTWRCSYVLFVSDLELRW